jgi:hypothetical protein
MDEVVLTAAEVKAIATNNPMLAEKMEVDNEVGRLRLLRGSWENERAVLERNIGTYYPGQIALHKRMIENIGADLELLNKTEKKDFKITIDGVTFDERARAGLRLMLIAKIDNLQHTGQQVTVGEYCGLTLSLARATEYSGIEFILKGGYSYRADLGESELGAISRIENIVDRIPKQFAEAKNQLLNYEQQLEEAKKEVVKPFEYEARLSQYVARQSEINTSLEFSELKKQEDDVILDAPDEENSDNRQQPELVGVQER